eukprot:gene12868-14193_t
MSNFKFLLLSIAWLLCLENADVEAKDDYELRLVNDLFKNRNYSKLARPVQNKSHPLVVDFGIAYVQLVELNDKEQMMISSIWVRQHWNNTHLAWDPEDYGNVTTINVDPKKVWLPDIVLYNNAQKGHGSGTMYKFTTKVIMRYDGLHKWYAPTIVRSGCNIDITYFPFDHQYCELKFGPWTYSSAEVDIRSMSDKVDLDKYLNSSQFKLGSARARRHYTKFGCCTFYPYVEFILHIERQPGFFLFNVIIPSLVITCFAILTFTSPHLTGERVGLAIESFLSLSFLCLMVAGSIPINSDVTPLITKFLLMCMAMISLAVLFNLISMNLLVSTEIPPLVRLVFFQILGPVVGVCEGRNKGVQKRRKSILNKEQIPKFISPNFLGVSKQNAAEMAEKERLVSYAGKHDPNGSTHAPNKPYKRFNASSSHVNARKPIPNGSASNKSTLESVMTNVEELVKKSHVDAIQSANRDFWRCVAQTLDRIFLLSFFLSFIFVSAVMLLKGFGNR